MKCVMWHPLLLLHFWLMLYFYRTKQNLVLNMHANHNRKGFLYTLHDYKISIPGKCRDDCAMQKRYEGIEDQML